MERPAHTSLIWLCFQCVEELSALLQTQALLLPALKLLLESQDERLHAVALEQVTAIAQVPVGAVVLASNDRDLSATVSSPVFSDHSGYFCFV